MQNDKNTNEKSMTLNELQREIEKQKAIISAKERGASAEELEKIEKEYAESKKEGSEDSSDEPKKATVLQKIGSALYISLNVFLALILAVNLYMIMAREIFKKSNPTLFGFGYFVVATESMAGDRADSIEAGTLVFTVKNKSYEVDDIITYEGEKVSSVTHRIIAVNEDGSYITRGDANNTEDTEVVLKENVAGRVFATVEGAGSFIAKLTSPIGLLALTVVCLGIFGIPLLFGYYDEEEE